MYAIAKGSGYATRQYGSEGRPRALPCILLAAAKGPGGCSGNAHGGNLVTAAYVALFRSFLQQPGRASSIGRA
ncbi:hypothetical protein ACN42_g1254 [Penicillium freii]|uniref:Uncharacterized protein n=1 Tax=Penicillium freii TaxID=48697 RepID=A0A117NRR3_PENFR|nr:hypothetical protein ACN42_g1254 [Penicillium freii]